MGSDIGEETTRDNKRTRDENVSFFPLQEEKHPPNTVTVVGDEHIHGHAERNV